MLRAIFGVVVGYTVMAVVLTVLWLGGFLALGLDRFFQPDSYEVSSLWIGISLVISVVCSLLGGYLCAAIGRSMGACKALALAVLVIGILCSLPKLREDTNWRAGEVPTLQVMNLAQAPRWMYIVTPALGAIGVLLGARLRWRPDSASRSAGC